MATPKFPPRRLEVRGSSNPAFPLPEKTEKTGLLSVVLLAHLIGPLRSRDWRGLVV